MAIEIGEEVATAGAIRGFISIGLTLGSTLVSLLFGHRPSQQEVTNTTAPFVHLMYAPFKIMNEMFRLMNVTLSTARVKMAQINSRIGAAYNQAVGITYRLNAATNKVVNSNFHTLDKWMRDLYNITSGRITATNQVVNSNYHTLDRNMRNLYNQAVGITYRQVGALTAVVNSNYHTLDRNMRDLYNAALTHADNIAAIRGQEARSTAEAQITAQVTQPTRATWPILIAELAGATAAAGPDLAGLRELIKAVPTRAPATLGEAATDPQTIDRVLLRALADCVIPNCRNLSKAGRDLQSLFGAVEGLAMLAFIAEIIHDPARAADDTVTVADPVMRDTVGAFVGLIGGA